MTQDNSTEPNLSLLLTQGQAAFESGLYNASLRLFEQAVACADPGTADHGEAQIWLVSACEAAGDRTRARELCKRVSRHPHLDTRTHAKRLLYILEAPELRSREDWLTEIPDLEQLESSDEKAWGQSRFVSTAPPRARISEPAYVIEPPTDPSKVVMPNDRSLLLALGVAVAIVVGWFCLA